MFSPRRLLFSLLIYLIGSETLISQSMTKPAQFTKEEIQILAKSRYGLDDVLVNGLVYCPENVNANGSPYFEYLDSKSSDLSIKGRHYIKRHIFYDIVLDQLILSVKLQNYFEPKIVLNSTFIDSFCMGNVHFINLAILDKNLKQFGYFEKVYSGREFFLKKYRKRFIDSFDLKNPHGRFSTQKFSYYILVNKNLIKVNRRRELLNIYPNHKKAIRKFIRQNKIKYRKANNQEIYKLLAFCYDVSK